MYVAASSSGMAALGREEDTGGLEEGSGGQEMGVTKQQETLAMTARSEPGVPVATPAGPVSASLELPEHLGRHSPGTANVKSRPLFILYGTRSRP